MFIQIKGKFKIFDAKIYTKAKDFSKAEIDVSVDSSSLTTGDAKCDKHLKSIDFLNSKKYKKITFTSTGIEETDYEDHYKLHGKLTIKCISKTIQLHVQFLGILEDIFGHEKAGLTISGKVNRND